MTDDIKTRLVSADPINCPITEFKLHDVRDENNESIPDQSGFNLTEAGIFTMTGYDKMNDGVYDVLVTATTGFDYFRAYNSQPVVKLKVSTIRPSEPYFT